MAINSPGFADGYVGLLRLAGEIGREPALLGLLEMILEKSRPWMRAEACSIFLPDPATGDLVIHSAHGDSQPQLGELRVPAGQGIVGAAMKEKRMIRVDDVSRDPRFFAQADAQTGWKTKALLAAPLLDGEECLGVIEFLNPQGRPAFSRADEEMMEYFAGLVSGALVRIRAHEATLERAQVQRDLELAREMQQGLLPKQFPTREQAPQLEIFARLDPAKEVSGDLYDFSKWRPAKCALSWGMFREREWRRAFYGGDPDPDPGNRSTGPGTARNSAKGKRTALCREPRQPVCDDDPGDSGNRDGSHGVRPRRP